MKDIVIKAATIKREGIVLLLCFVAVNLWNAYAIFSRGTQWSELYTVWYAVLVVTIVVYVLLIPLRWIGCKLGHLLKRAFCRRKR